MPDPEMGWLCAVNQVVQEIPSTCFFASFQVKDLLHLRPPLSFSARSQWFLQWLHHHPPLLCFCICRDSCLVGCEIAPMIFEVTK